MNKINYNEVYKEEVAKLNSKPSLFLHVCCGPCATYPLKELMEHFKVTIGYINPNIYPYEEYLKRRDELLRFIKEENLGVEVIELPYNHEEYLNSIKGREEDLEGGQRCSICHKLRLELSYKYAYENKFDYFTTVMTVSSKKPAQIINEIGFELEKKYSTTKYLPSDFKKENGQLKGINLAKEHSLYRQDYCGCEFSLSQRRNKREI